MKTAANSPQTGSTSVRLGLALGGGFARGIAHAGVLKVFEENRIPIHCVTGISAGAIVAAAYASGATPAEIAQVGRSMRLGDLARPSLGGKGLLNTKRMDGLLKRLLKAFRFEQMRMPLGVIATDLCNGSPAAFTSNGSVFEPVRASCAYPGIFEPVIHDGRVLVDGALSVSVPAALAHQLGATHVISVSLPAGHASKTPANMFQVLGRCLQILQARCEENWRADTDMEIVPDVRGVEWNAFHCAERLLRAGEAAALEILPKIQSFLNAAELRPCQFSTAVA